EHCLKCHGPGKQEGGLNLATRESLVKGGDSGAALVDGEPEASLLLQAVEYLGQPKMPPSGKLPADKIELLRRWVASGAAWPKDSPLSDGMTTTRRFEVSEKQKSWWAFQPVRDHAPPPVQAASWPRHDLDRFILAKLEAAGIAPPPEADRIPWLRRAAFRS
ncbi:MAG: c-type cytochrome domain-containing protein, partial [Planctomycetaceae bacterium]